MPKRKKKRPYVRRRPRRDELTLMNFKISERDRRMFLDKAEKATRGNVSALILKSVKLATITKIRGMY